MAFSGLPQRRTFKYKWQAQDFASGARSYNFTAVIKKTKLGWSVYLYTR